jgi:signal transduction histidine kinase
VRRVVQPRGLWIRLIASDKLDLLACGALGVLSVVFLGDSRHPFPAVLIAVAGCSAVAFRRQAPVTAVVVAVAAAGLVSITDAGAQQVAQAITVALCVFSLGSRPAASRVPDGVLLCAVAGILVSFGGSAVNVFAKGLLVVVFPYLAGRVVSNRRQQTSDLESDVEDARRKQEMRARVAAVEERTRIAREIHDVLAHSLSVMVIQAMAAREVAAGNATDAAVALRAVQTSGREALQELRGMVGVLRRGDVDLVTPWAPGLDQLGRLAERAQASGLPVELEIVGEQRRMPATIELIAFRLVQEALTNAIKHAGAARTTVTVTFASDALELEVRDNGPGGLTGHALTGAGHGLVGMRERVELIDGVLLAGPRPRGGFRVYARLPLAGVAA